MPKLKLFSLRIVAKVENERNEAIKIFKIFSAFGASKYSYKKLHNSKHSKFPNKNCRRLRRNSNFDIEIIHKIDN